MQAATRLDPRTVRPITKLVTAHHQLEGAGFRVRRPFPTADFDAADPLLLIDEMGPMTYGPGEAVGAPDHPHRGFETVTYILEGEFEHEDSAGHRGIIRAGDVQWMTAGGGIVHSEMPSRAIREQGGTVHGFQIWVNLPARLKMTRPRYQGIAAADIPSVRSADGLASVKVIAGEALGARAVVGTHTPIVFQDWTLERGADVTTTASSSDRLVVYVFAGEARVGEGDEAVRAGQLAVLGAGDAVRLRGAEDGTRLLLLGGAPLAEPVARYGPFVMNTRAQLVEAFEDFQSGKMGEITRTAQH